MTISVLQNWQTQQFVQNRNQELWCTLKYLNKQKNYYVENNYKIKKWDKSTRRSSTYGIFKKYKD